MFAIKSLSKILSTVSLLLIALSSQAAPYATVTGSEAQEFVKALGTDELERSYSLSLIGYVSEKKHPEFIFHATTTDDVDYYYESSDQALIERLFMIAAENGIRINFRSAGSSYKTADISVVCSNSDAETSCEITDTSVELNAK